MTNKFTTNNHANILNRLCSIKKTVTQVKSLQVQEQVACVANIHVQRACSAFWLHLNWSGNENMDGGGG